MPPIDDSDLKPRRELIAEANRLQDEAERLIHQSKKLKEKIEASIQPAKKAKLLPKREKE